HLSENMLLPVRIHRTESFVSPDYMKTRMTISCDADTSGTVAVLGFPHPYTRKKRLLEDKPVLFYPGNDSCYYIEGAQFASICDGREREVLLEYDGTNITRENPMMMNYSTWPEKFITKRKRIDNGMGGSGYMWDWFHTEAWPHVVEIANAWPDPPVLSYITPVKVGDRSHRRQGALSFLKKSLNVWRFEIPKELAYASSDVIFSFNGPGRDAFFSLPDSSRNIRFFCDKSYERDARECLEVLQPVIEEFCGLYGIGETARINVNLPTHILKQIRIGKIQYIRYSRYSGNSQWLLGNITSNIFSVQTQILNDLFWQRMRFLGLFGKYTKELQSFLNNNMTRGLNHAFSPDQTFLPPAFSPTPRHLDDKLLRQQGATPRKMWENRSVTPPVFQMLYLVMGHDAWIQMLKLLREGVEEHNQDETFIQTCAEQAWEQPLDWFFDFWMNSDLEFPRYRLDKAEARILEQGDEDQTRYELTVVLANETGGRMPVPLVIETAISRMENKVWVGAGETVSWSIVIR
ncbi:MAG TPA: hypothetical protein PLB62_15470, partial [Candidatus Sumerlaeota bacterium]|nr:hypothetical protein [Candidatus Sumerlaeota bacterium]